MQPGDVLYFCGLHNGGDNDQQIVVGAAGVTVSGACPGDPGVLWSTGRRLTDWTRIGPGHVYATAYRGVASQVLNSTKVALTPLKAIPGKSSPCNSWFQSDRFYYKSCGVPSALHPNGATPAVLIRVDHATVEDLTVFNSPRLIEISDATGVTLRRLRLYYAIRKGVHLMSSTSNGRILDSEIFDVGNGIVASTTARERHDGWLVEGNYIHDVTGGPDDDAHCIGWQNGNNNRISRNRLENCAGPALAVYWWPDHGPLRSNEWSYNEVSSPANTAISISGSNCPPASADAGDNLAIGNQIHGGPTAFYVKVAPHSLSVLNNFVSDADVGLRWKYISGGNAAAAPPPFDEAGNIWDAASPYQPPLAAYPCQ
jgi:hypothetical protein